METHVRVAAWLRIIGSAVYLLAALVVAILFSGLGVALGLSGDHDAAGAAPVMLVVGTAVSLFLGLLGLPGLIVGWGLLTRRPWARIVNIALSAFEMFNIPVGTAIGAYSIWAMLQPETIELFEHGSLPGRYPIHF